MTFASKLVGFAMVVAGLVLLVMMVIGFTEWLAGG